MEAQALQADWLGDLPAPAVPIDESPMGDLVAPAVPLASAPRAPVEAPEAPLRQPESEVAYIFVWFQKGINHKGNIIIDSNHIAVFVDPHCMFTRFAHLDWIRSGDAIRNALTTSRFR